MVKQQNNVRVPQISSVEKALEIFYTKTELSNFDITELFGKHSSATVARLKAKVREQMSEQGVVSWNAQCVNTAVAFKTWGIDVSDLEHRLKKIRELKRFA